MHVWRRRLLKRNFKNSKNFCKSFDRDKKVLSIANELEKKFPNRFKFYQKKFSQLDTILSDKIDVIIFDLGLSSIQLDDLERGFSFNSKQTLNMAMGLNNNNSIRGYK